MLAVATARRLALTLVLGLFAVLAAAVVSSGFVAKADPAYPPQTNCALSTTSASVQPGGTLELTGSGFPANSSVDLVLDSQSTPLGTATTDSDGSFQTTVTIPASIGAGNHSVVASSGTTTCSLASFGLGGSSVSRTSSTGFDAANAIVIAMVLLGGGAALILVARRRSTV